MNSLTVYHIYLKTCVKVCLYWMWPGLPGYIQRSLVQRRISKNPLLLQLNIVISYEVSFPGIYGILIRFSKAMDALERHKYTSLTVRIVPHLRNLL